MGFIVKAVSLYSYVVVDPGSYVGFENCAALHSFRTRKNSPCQFHGTPRNCPIATHLNFHIHHILFWNYFCVFDTNVDKPLTSCEYIKDIGLYRHVLISS